MSLLPWPRQPVEFPPGYTIASSFYILLGVFTGMGVGWEPCLTLRTHPRVTARIGLYAFIVCIVQSLVAETYAQN